MKSSKEFFDRLREDEDFQNEVNEAIQAKRDAGAQNYYETFIPVAAERGYEVTKEELDEINEKRSEIVTDEELGKVAGGTSCIPTPIVISATVAAATIGAGLTYTVSQLVSHYAND